MAEKISKKERKALKFKKRKRGDDEDLELLEKPATQKAAAEELADTAPAAKKPKTEKKAPPRFILFIGNLPYNLTEEQLREHFNTANPSVVRMRKGFAFMEFNGADASKDLHIALRFHHTMLNYRKINVELTAGGGGNSTTRRKKLKNKNAKLQVEINERVEAEKKAKEEKEKAEAKAAKSRSKLKPKDEKSDKYKEHSRPKKDYYKEPSQPKKDNYKKAVDNLSAADLKAIHPERLKQLRG